MSCNIVDGVLTHYEKLEDVALIPESVHRIAKEAFSGIISLKCIELPESLECIDTRAFYGCSNVERIIIKGNPVIQERAFEGCGVEGFCIEKSDIYSSIEGVLFNKDRTKLIVYPAHKKVAEYRVPEGVTQIQKNAFCGDNVYVFVIFLPESIHEIRKGTFEFRGNCKEPAEFEKYMTEGMDPDYYEVAFWHGSYVAFYDSDLIFDLPGGLIYLGGPLEDIPGLYKSRVTYGFLYAMQVGLQEIEQYKESYFEYIMKNEIKFGRVLDTFGYRYMLKERLLSKELVSESLKHSYLEKKPELKEVMLKYIAGC